MGTKSENAENSADREMVTPHLCNPPREMVFNAWTGPRHVAQWVEEFGGVELLNRQSIALPNI